MYDDRMSSTPTVARRLTVNLIQKADNALGELMAASGDSLTDTVNRALQIYAFIDSEIRAGSTVILRNSDGDQVLRIL